VGGGRIDHFNQFGDVWTYRVAGSYFINRTATRLHASLATGFSPPSSQDKIFGENFGLQPERGRGFDVGIEQWLWGKCVRVGATYFHNDLSNLIGNNGLFETLNLGAARTQGLELEGEVRPLPALRFYFSYTYLDTEKNFFGGYFATAGRPPAAAAAERSLSFGFVSLVREAAHDRGSEIRERARGIEFRRSEFRYRRLFLPQFCGGVCG
jgi:vitamin B12 transporter